MVLVNNDEPHFLNEAVDKNHELALGIKTTFKHSLHSKAIF